MSVHDQPPASAPEALRTALTRLGIDPAGLAPLFANLPEPSFRVLVAGDRAADVWHQLRTQAAQTGYWPVIMGDADEFDQHHDYFDVDVEEAAMNGLPLKGVDEAMAQALAIDVPAWFATQRAEVLSDLDMEEFAGEWPDDDTPVDTFIIPATDTTNVLALLPTSESWRAPLYLRWGGWNECPSPPEQAAILKWWGERYDADLFAVNADQLEMWVGRPPQDREQALALAYEHFWYCTDNVTQGTFTTQQLAADLLGSHVWHFWWD